jgi:hypothetical protein
MDRAADELFIAAKKLELGGWTLALGHAEGNPIEFWGVDEGLQEVAHRLNGIAANVRTRSEAKQAGPEDASS